MHTPRPSIPRLLVRALLVFAALALALGPLLARAQSRPADTAAVNAVVRKLTAPPDTVVRWQHDTATVLVTRVDTLVVFRTDTLWRVRVDTVVAAAPAPTPAPVPVPIVPPKPPDSTITPASTPSTPRPAPAVPVDTASRSLYLAAACTYYPTLWKTDGPNWGGDYYDRSNAYRVFSTWAGFCIDAATARQRADTIAVDYRVKYLEASGNASNKCNPIANWALMHGLYGHWIASRLAGDTANANADYRMIQCLPDNLRGFIPSPYFLGLSNGDTRIAARVLDMLRGGRRAAAIAGDSALVRRRWADEQAAVDRLMLWQHADGSFPQAQTCGADLNYMDGMLQGSLAETRADHPMPGADTLLVRSARWVLTQMRLDTIAVGLPARKQPVWSVSYASAQCTNGGPTPAPDLNQDFTYGLLTAYRITGDSTFLIAADRLFASGARGAYYIGSKQLNESFNPTALLFYLERPTP